MTPKVNPIPQGYHTVTPSLIVEGPLKPWTSTRRRSAPKKHCACPARAERYPRGVQDRRFGPHAHGRDARHGVQESPGVRRDIGWLLLYVENVDAAWRRAVDAAPKQVMPLQDMFWGDRTVVWRIPSAISGTWPSTWAIRPRRRSRRVRRHSSRGPDRLVRIN